MSKSTTVILGILVGVLAVYGISQLFTGGSGGTDTNVVNNIKDATGKVADTAKDAANKAADTAKDATGKVADTAKDAANKAADTANGAANKAKKVITLKVDKDGKTQVVDTKDISDPSVAKDVVVNSSEAISVDLQKAGKLVKVNSVNMQEGANGGWVVVHEVKSGVRKNALGATRIDSGSQKDVYVKLLRGMTAGGDYEIVLYKDNGDRKFDMKVDMPSKTVGGKGISAKFKAS
jgi:hypothetical protein